MTASLVAPVAPVAAQGGGQGGSAVSLVTPGRVTPGEAFQVGIVVRGEEAAGFEGSLRWDTGAASFAGARPGAATLPGGSDPVHTLPTSETGWGTPVGVYTCAEDACGEAPEPATDPPTRGGATTMLVVDLVADEVGALELALSDVVLVDADGERLDAGDATARVVVDKGQPVHPAPAVPAPEGDTTTSEADAVEAEAEADTVDSADVDALASDWSGQRQQGGCEGDGCVDVADVMAATSTAVAADEAPAPEGGGAALVLRVTTTGDAEDADPGNGVCRSAWGSCTLRAAIMEANASPGSDFIQFAIPGDGPHVIRPRSALQVLSDTSGPTVIDGYSQPGSQPNTHATVSNADIRIHIAGPGERARGTFAGLRVTSADNVIRGLSITGFYQQVLITGAAASGNAVIGNLIGIDPTPAAGSAATEPFVGANGVTLSRGARANEIGRNVSADRNVISGNGHQGVATYDWGTDANLIRNNLIGLAPEGVRRRSNQMHGIDINYGSSHNRIGGLGLQDGNVVSGNRRNGIEISHGANTTGNYVQNNFVGTDPTGYGTPLEARNYSYGIQLEDRVVGNVVRANVVANNLDGGVVIVGGPKQNQVSFNRIGVNVGGSPAGNGRPAEGTGPGVRLEMGGFGNTVDNNVIANNQGDGIEISGEGSNNNTFSRNSTYDNGGFAIDLAPLDRINQALAAPQSVGPNKQIGQPTIETASPATIGGRGCGGCTIELFVSDTAPAPIGEGRTFLAATEVVNGRYTFSADLAPGRVVTATATDSVGNTSEFSNAVQVPTW